MNASRIELMHKLLTTALQPESCEIIDEGHLHIGHEGARGGRGHYRIRIASPRFQRPQPHRPAPARVRRTRRPDGR
jgi:BolA protein